MIFYSQIRSTTLPVHGLPEGLQAQAPPHGAQAFAQRREALSVLQVPEAILALGQLQPAHEPPVLLLQALQGIGKRHLSAAHLPTRSQSPRSALDGGAQQSWTSSWSAGSGGESPVSAAPSASPLASAPGGHGCLSAAATASQTLLERSWCDATTATQSSVTSSAGSTSAAIAIWIRIRSAADGAVLSPPRWIAASAAAAPAADHAHVYARLRLLQCQNVSKLS